MPEDEDPYVGRESVFHFDEMIIAVTDKSKAVAVWTHSAQLSDLQRAASELVPHTISLALAVRELVRSGYLFAAEVLIRPILERVAVLSYLADEGPEATSLWSQGWPYKTRPSLATMLGHMKGPPSAEDKQVARDIVDHFNAIIHADPIGSYRNLGTDRDGRSGFLSGPTATDVKKCDDICFQVAMYLVIVLARMTQVFPEVSADTTMSSNAAKH
jgi:hypothetical protein